MSNSVKFNIDLHAEGMQVNVEFDSSGRRWASNEVIVADENIVPLDGEQCMYTSSGRLDACLPDTEYLCCAVGGGLAWIEEKGVMHTHRHHCTIAHCRPQILLGKLTSF